MLTATKDRILPTTVTGSWPRPAWFTGNLAGRPFSNAMLDTTFREQFIDANASLVSEQERAGLDILTNGDYHIDGDLGGGSWISYPVERLEGTSELALERSDFWRFSASSSDSDGAADAAYVEWPFPLGTWLSEIVSGWRYPSVVGKLGLRIPFEFGKIWRIAQACSDRPVKFSTVSADICGSALTLRTSDYPDDKRALMWDLATIVNGELRELAAAGCKAIQIDDPAVYYLASLGADDDVLDFHTDLYNRQVEGLDDVEIWIHTCWGNAGSQRSAHPGYDEACVDLVLNRLKGDVWTIESKESGHAPLPLFASHKGRLPKKIAVGFVSHRVVNVESADEVAADVRTALEYIDADKLILSSDCGFGRQGVPRPVAYYKAAALAQGANIVRRELGVEAARVVAAEPAFQIDEPPQAVSHSDRVTA
jgi:5-methyltetrahydropteroyltriglutamate--homocysteine methyltransferase